MGAIFIFYLSYTMSCCENNEEQKDVCSSEAGNGCRGKGCVIFLLILSILTNLGTGYYLSMGGLKSGNTEAVASAVIEKYLANEYAKAGNKENYDLLAKAQRLQMEDQIPQIKQFIAGKEGGKVETGKTPASGDTTATAAKTLTQDEIAAIKKTAYIEGNKDALITLVEYSDLECPFCIRQYKEETIKKTRDAFGDKVNSAFKNFR